VAEEVLLRVTVAVLLISCAGLQEVRAEEEGVSGPERLYRNIKEGRLVFKP
jgi:hypothetical protein